MKKIAFLVTALFVVCDVPGFAGSPYLASSSESTDHVYHEYCRSLLTLQQDIAKLSLDIREKNSQAVYEQILHITEETAVLIGVAEKASQDVYNGFQGSLQGRLEILWEYGLTGDQKNALLDAGYTEDDIHQVMKSLTQYNDYYYHAVRGFHPEQLQFFYSMGLTDEQILALQTDISNHYTRVHTLKEAIKEHQTELLYVQVQLSVAALKTVSGQKEKGKNTVNGLKNAEEKLLDILLTVSEDTNSLEQVKAHAKQVYKAAEQQIRNGNTQCAVDFFVGLQIHCGAVTALHGDTLFGLREMRKYEGALSALITGINRSEQGVPPGNEPSPFGTGAVLDVTGQIEESDEDNNAGYIVLIAKTGGTKVLDFVHMMAEWNIPSIVETAFERLLECVGLEPASLVVSAGGVVFMLIVSAEPVGASWVECVVPCMVEDPSGIFAQIFEDKETVETIEAGASKENKVVCERKGYSAVYTDPGQIIYTIMCAIEVYRSPDNHYYYYTKDISGDSWVVEVEIFEHECCGRVVRAFQAICRSYACSGYEDLTIREKWILCDNFTLVWSRSNSIQYEHSQSIILHTIV
jgi:hypothetical protein